MKVTSDICQYVQAMRTLQRTQSGWEGGADIQAVRRIGEQLIDMAGGGRVAMTMLVARCVKQQLEWEEMEVAADKLKKAMEGYI